MAKPVVGAAAANGPVEANPMKHSTQSSNLKTMNSTSIKLFSDQINNTIFSIFTSKQNLMKSLIIPWDNNY